MKNLILLFFLATIGNTTFAQVVPKIELKLNGLVGPDSTKNYIVIETPKMSKADLYKKTLTYLNSIYKNPAKVISTVDGESITVNGYSESVKGTFNWYLYPMKYNITIQFKDGKMRFEPFVTDLAEKLPGSNSERKIYINSMDSPNKAEVSCVYLVVQKTGKVILFKEEIKTGIENWMNEYVAGIVKSFNDNW